MSLHVHKISGCSPAPLALYLKALGILRIVAEQADSSARGWWQDEHFCLMTKLDRCALEKFFLEDYSPSPVFNPWGARSGFYGGGSESTSRMALKAIEFSTSSRLAEFRNAISMIRREVDAKGGDKPGTEEARVRFQRSLRRNARGNAARWLDTVLADIGTGIVGLPIYGSGGNEGSGGYPSAYYAAVTECIVRQTRDSQLSSTLWEQSHRPTLTWDGDFRAANETNPKKSVTKSVNGPFRQFMAEDNATAWDLIFLFEGSLLIQTGVTARSSSHKSKYLSSPFYFEPHGVGSSTSCDSDEFVVNKGKRLPGRGEQWFPLWSRPTTLVDLSSVLIDGRCSIGRRRANKPTDAARAVARLGVARGVDQFLRYGYFQRNNLATHIAVPLGRISVPKNPTGQSHLIDDIAGWMNKLQRLARDSHGPARLVHAERRLADAVFAALTHDHTPARWRLILDAAADIESIQAAGTAFAAGPIPKLKPAWVSAIYDGSDDSEGREVRLALALASGTSHQPFWPMRHHFLPLKPGARHYQTSDKRLSGDPQVVATGRDAITDCGAIVLRRFIDSEDAARLPLQSAKNCGASLADLAALIDGHVNLDRVLKLARALMAIDWYAWNNDSRAHQPRQHSSDEHPEEAWLALRLACLPWKLGVLDIKAEPTMIRRLLAGDGTAAVAIAKRRLWASGLRVPFEAALADDETARFWAAALAFPISKTTANRAVNILFPNSSTGDPNA